MITTIQPDRQKAESLKAAAETTLQRLQETDIEKYPSNTLKDYYDVAHMIMDAIALVDGVKSRGEGAHQELIDYIANKYSLGEQTRQFLQQMRDYRNRISYEGFTINKNYIVLNQEKIKQTIKTLSEKLRNLMVVKPK